MLVVFDTNVFHGDVRADRSVLRSLLDEAVAKGAFELFVPDVVLQELDKQFGARSKKVVREINAAIAERADELSQLGLERPSRMTRDESDVSDYRASLERRITDVGGVVLPMPADLSVAVTWAVHRRKPFKQSGEGLQDATIWLSVLELAGARAGEIVLVSDNAKDFGKGDDQPGLADELRADLTARGLPPEKVRLVPGLHAFAEEVSQRLAETQERAEQMAGDGTFGGAIELAVMWSRLDQYALALGVELDDDPQVIAMDIAQLTVQETTQLPGGGLLVEAIAEVNVLLHLLIFKADYYTAAEGYGAHFTLAGTDFNDHYVEAESEVSVLLELTISTDVNANEIQVEVGDVTLTPVEIVQRALHGRDLSELLHLVRDEVAGAVVDGYEPDERIESTVDEALVEHAHRDSGSVQLRELLEVSGERHVCDLVVSLQGDVAWTVNAPTPFDVEHFASLAENEESGAPVLHDLDYEAPLDVDLVASWDIEHGWHNLELNQVQLDEGARRRRLERGTAAEDLLNAHDESVEPDEDASAGQPDVL